MAKVYSKIVNGVQVVLGPSTDTTWAVANGFSLMDEPSNGAVLSDVNANDIEGMTVRQRTGVLKKIVQALKGGVAAVAVVLAFTSFGDADTAQLGDLTDSSTVVTNVDLSGVLTKTQGDGYYFDKTLGMAWSRYWGGDDFVVTVTNYPTAKGANRSPSGKMPQLSMSWKTQDADGTNYQQIVWNEAWWQNWLTGEYLPTNYYTKSQINSELAQKADRAWGFYDSHTGLYSPDEFTQVSSSNILIAAGMSYQQTVTTKGSVWVLTSHSSDVVLKPTTNGFFRISDAEGNTVFEIIKGDKQTVGAKAGGVSVNGDTLTILYAVESDAHPDLSVCTSLTDADWKAETDASCPATVVWTGASGSWTATVTPKATRPQLFAKATYEQGGDTYIKNTAPVSTEYMILGGKKYKLGTAVISGNTVLTLTAQ